MSWRSRTTAPPWVWLSLWTAIGLAVRVETVLSQPDRKPGGDTYAYFYGARLLVAGRGFIDPYALLQQHQVVQSAAYAPLFMLTLTVPMIVGLKSFLVARLWICILSAAAIPVAALVGRLLSGWRAGLIAAAATALYPNMWMPDTSLAAEAIVPLTVGVVLLCAYRLWAEPNVKRALWLGVTMGILFLGRDELTLLVFFLLVPLVVIAGQTWKQRVKMIGAAGLAIAVVIGPWVGYNMARFQKPTFISNEAGLTMASASCNLTYYGSFLGYWDVLCSADAPVKYHGDQSVENGAYEKYALSYIKHHESRLPIVVLAREGRTFGFYRPNQQIFLDSYVETRPHEWALIGLYSYWTLLALSPIGSVLMRRRRVPVFPLWALGLNVVVSVAIAFGNTRYRIPFEVPLVLMAAVAVEGAWNRLSGHHSAPDGASGGAVERSEVDRLVTPGAP